MAIDNNFAKKKFGLKQLFNNKSIIFSLLLIIGILITFAFLRYLSYPETKSPQLTPPAHQLQMLAFFENGWGGVYGDSWPGFQEHYRFIDLLSPFWYSLDDEGRIRVNRSRDQVRDFAASQEIPILPLVTNWQGGSGGFLIHEPARRTSLTNLRDLAQYYQGLNLDIEYLPPSFKTPLTQYIQDLHTLLAQDQKQLLVCVYPQVDFPASRSGIHDYQSFAAACDGLILMAYDYHRPGTTAGPVAPLSWVEANIQNVLQNVPPEKLWLGIPGYGYQWRDAGTRPLALPAWKVEQDARERAILPQWDSASQTPFFSYSESGAAVTVWYENQRSTVEKLKLAKKYRLQGVTLWRLGYEVKEFWDSLN